MRDTQPLCRELIGRRGHGALAPFVTREHECRQREGTQTISVESQRGGVGKTDAEPIRTNDIEGSQGLPWAHPVRSSMSLSSNCFDEARP